MKLQRVFACRPPNHGKPVSGGINVLALCYHGVSQMMVVQKASQRLVFVMDNLN